MPLAANSRLSRIPTKQNVRASLCRGAAGRPDGAPQLTSGTHRRMIAGVVSSAAAQGPRHRLLAGGGVWPYLCGMRVLGFVTAIAAMAVAQAGWAAPAGKAHHSWTPVAIGTFADWRAATHPEAGVRVCYAFTFAKASKPVLVGRGRVVLTVAERPGERDAVAVSLGYAVLPHAGASVQAGGKRLHFYLEGRSAFAPHGREAIAAFQAGREAVGSFPGPRGVTLADSFSLNGFAAAYAAVQKACPEK